MWEYSGIDLHSTNNVVVVSDEEVDGLQAAGYKVHLANPAAMKRYNGLKHSGDETDAAHLAHLLRLGILPSGYIYPVAERGLPDLARRRAQLVRHRTMHVLAVENVQARQSGSRMSGAKVKRLSLQEVLGVHRGGHMARRHCAEARRFHDRKRAKTNAIVATKELAHKRTRLALLTTAG